MRWGYPLYDRSDNVTVEEFNYMYIPQPLRPLPHSGVIYQYSWFVTSPGNVTFQIWRPINITNKEYILINQYDQYVGIGRNATRRIRNPLNITVERGDLLGFYAHGNTTIPFRGALCKNTSRQGLYLKDPVGVTEGRIFTFNRLTVEQWPCRQYSYRAHMKGVLMIISIHVYI